MAKYLFASPSLSARFGVEGEWRRLAVCPTISPEPTMSIVGSGYGGTIRRPGYCRRCRVGVTTFA